MSRVEDRSSSTSEVSRNSPRAEADERAGSRWLPSFVFHSGRMFLTIFQADKGDCLLLTSTDGKRMLIDGGMPASFKASVQPELEKLASKHKKPFVLDLIYVSHIDQDHIGGVLELFRWRAAAKDKFPIRLRELWHNGFSIPGVEATLGSTAKLFRHSRDPKVKAEGERVENVALSVAEALELQRHAEKLTLNRPAKGRLMMVPKNKRRQRHSLGSLQLEVLAPFAADLDALQREWNDWVKTAKGAVKRLKAALKRIQPLSANTASRDADALYRGLLRVAPLSAGALGKRSAVTTPNLASLMLLVSEANRTLLLTGDGHCDDLVEGLSRAGKLERGKCHVNVLKVQHHGSRNNVSPAFWRNITADTYVFTGNGKHNNPHPDVLKALAKERAKDRRQFSLIFNSDEHTNGAASAHMKKVRKLVAKLKLRATFLSNEPLTLTV